MLFNSTLTYNRRVLDHDWVKKDASLLFPPHVTNRTRLLAITDHAYNIENKGGLKMNIENEILGKDIMHWN